MARHNSLLAAALAVGALLCNPIQASIYNTRFPGTTWDDTNWRITTTVPDTGHYQSRMSLANGYIGINLAALGPFFEVDKPVAGDDINGWPLFSRRQTFSTVTGFWDYQPTTEGTNFGWLNQYGGESTISGLPHWGGLHVKAPSGEVLGPSTPLSEIKGFNSTLDIHNGILYWTYTWTPAKSGVPVKVEYSMLVHKLYVNQAAVRLRLTPQKNVNVSVIDVLNGDCAVRTTFVNKVYDSTQPVIWSAVRPNGISNVTAYVYSAMVGDASSAANSRSRYTDTSIIGGNVSSIAQAMNVGLAAGKTSTVYKYIGIASTDAFPNPQNIATTAMQNAMKQGFDKMLASHSAEWHSIMTPDSVDSYRNANGQLPADPNILEMQITAVSNPFHLIQNTVGANAIKAANNNDKLDINSIAVGGLGSDSYAGFIFWDADVWMAPGLVVAFPQAARQIARYRSEKLPQAHRNILTAYQSSQNQTGKFSPNGAVYSWTSGRFGNCTGTGPCFDYQYHLNGDIGLQLYNYYVATGDTAYFRQNLFPVYDAVAQLFADLVTFNKTSKMYDLYNATDPDEYANFVSNVGYTMVLMKTHINTANSLRSRLGIQPNATWSKIASLINPPVNKDVNIILEYTGMNGSISVKQADIVLIDDFLEYPNQYALSDLDYYASKQSLSGPGMTYAVFSINANALSPSGCSSYTYDLYGSEPYIRAPWFQYSEQLVDNFQANFGTHPAYPFLTGMGGANRVAVFGYLGLKLDLDYLSVDPSLPPQIPQITYRTIYWQGWPIKAKSNQTHTVLSRTNNPLPNANSTYAKSPIPVKIGTAAPPAYGSSKSYPLAMGGSITLPNRQIGNVKTIPGNLAQCQPVTNYTQSYQPGQFPLSAIDGATSTKWQPVNAGSPASMTISLPSSRFVPITGLKFDWAQSPPKSFKVFFSNSSTGTPNVLVAQTDSVKISTPYDPAIVDIVRPYMSNTTNVTLAKPVWSGRFATLVIQGNQANEGNVNSGVGASVAEWAIVQGSGKGVGESRV